VMIRRHADLLADWVGETYGLSDLRKHMAWYLKGFGVGGEVRSALAQVSSFSELDDLLGKLEADQPFPIDVLGRPRGRTTGDRAVSLPYGWLEDRGSRLVPAGAERDDSGG
jgi:Dihydrouridine synthase (Dus)